MATKSKSTRRTASKSKRSRSTAKKSSSRSKPRGKKRTVGHNPFAPGAKVGVYHAHEVGPQRDIRRAPLGEPIATVTANDEGALEFNVKDSGDYVLAAPSEANEEIWDYQIVSVKK